MNLIITQQCENMRRFVKLEISFNVMYVILKSWRSEAEKIDYSSVHIKIGIS